MCKFGIRICRLLITLRHNSYCAHCSSPFEQRNTLISKIYMPSWTCYVNSHNDPNAINKTNKIINILLHVAPLNSISQNCLCTVLLHTHLFILYIPIPTSYNRACNLRKTRDTVHFSDTMWQYF